MACYIKCYRYKLWTTSWCTILVPSEHLILPLPSNVCVSVTFEHLQYDGVV